MPKRGKPGRDSEIELSNLPDYPVSPENPVSSKIRQPDQELLKMGAAARSPWDLASQTEGPLSNELRGALRLLKPFRESFYKPNGDWKYPQDKPKGPGGHWITK